MCDLCLVSGCVKGCPNYDEDRDGFIICPNCGEHLYDGDTHYPELDTCEFCIDEYKKIVEIEREGLNYDGR